ncbi:hypothetical protein T4E_3367 [Trichinella pseudospiralis]|uniref:Uncharacterized protein n=1 Tax=Trichinella pseudospiralis TaxID=6337 RepID=A0A0V0XY07_TRIPS|nr:hypothetical protein T4E_3367 [Trichinella pseudospiralis]
MHYLFADNTFSYICQFLNKVTFYLKIKFEHARQRSRYTYRDRWPIGDTGFKVLSNIYIRGEERCNWTIAKIEGYSPRGHCRYTVYDMLTKKEEEYSIFMSELILMLIHNYRHSARLVESYISANGPGDIQCDTSIVTREINQGQKGGQNTAYHALLGCPLCCRCNGGFMIKFSMHYLFADNTFSYICQFLNKVTFYLKIKFEHARQRSRYTYRDRWPIGDTGFKVLSNIYIRGEERCNWTIAKIEGYSPRGHCRYTVYDMLTKKEEEYSIFMSEVCSMTDLIFYS